MNLERLVLLMRAVVTVIGKDAVGILAKVSTKCAEYNANVIEVTQSVLQDLFAMIMLVDITKLNSDFATMADGLGQTMGVKIHTMHEDIFNCMHHI
jgi:ACT domain-containing protein